MKDRGELYVLQDLANLAATLLSTGNTEAAIVASHPLTMIRTAFEPAAEQPAPALTEWDGEGLPPVGTTCETQIGASWVECSVIAHHAVEGRPCAVWVTPDGKRSGIWDEPGFRPIRTPEQIAAEKRAEEIAEIAKASGLRMRDGAVEVATALYEAGYRKQVAP